MRRGKEIYLDSAATSYPKPASVLRATKHTLEREGGNPGRSSHRLSLLAAERVYLARCALAELFSLPDERCAAFTKNATEAINLAIAAFTQRGGHVLTSDLEHNAVLRPLYALEDAGRIALEIFPAKEGAAAVAQRIRPDTALVVCTHASNVCPFLLDACAVGEVCRAHNVPFVLDASQSAGHVPLSLPAVGADAVCIPGHKGLLGIMGAGAVLFSSLREDLPPFLSGGSGAHSTARTMPVSLPEHFEAGTLPLPAIAALEAGVREVLARGTEEIAGNIKETETLLFEGLCAIRGITLYTGGHRGGGILCFTHDRLSPAHLADELDKEGVAVRAGLHCAPLAHATIGSPKGGCVRVSLDGRTTARECRRFLNVLSKIAASYA